MRRLDRLAALERDPDGVAHPLDAGRPRAAEHGHAAPGEHVLEHLGRVGVLAREHPVTAADQHDVDPERVVGAGELGARDA